MLLEVVIIKAQDSNEVIEGNTCSISIPDNIGLSQTANLPAKLKLCVDAMVMLTDNTNASDRLINGSIGTAKPLGNQSHFVVQYVWNLMTLKLAIPWKIKGFVVSWRNVYQLLLEFSFKERKRYCHC